MSDYIMLMLMCQVLPVP